MVVVGVVLAVVVVGPLVVLVQRPGVDQLVVQAYENLVAPELDGLAGRITEVLRTGEPPVEWRGTLSLLHKKGITCCRGTGSPYAVPSQRSSWCGWWSSGGYSRGCMKWGFSGTTCGGPHRK